MGQNRNSSGVPRVRTIGGPVTQVSPYSPPNLSTEEVAEVKKSFQESWGSFSATDKNDATDYYFNSYAHFSIHDEMIKDNVRTGAYQRAILDNPHLFHDKVVLDVGAGTGILSMFAAKAGAKHVYALECSNIYEVAKVLIERNKLSDVITVIHGKAEEVELPVKHVDIIISEWMGYFLLYESMLDTVLFCRDKWLVEGGLMFPDKATLHLGAIEDADYRCDRFDFWDNCYGFDFHDVKKYIMEEPVVDVVEKDRVVTDVCTVLELNLSTCKVSDLDFCSPFKLRLKRQDYVHALVGWFDCSFTYCHYRIVFSTSPFSQYTHWKQTVFYIDRPICALEDETITGWIAVRKNAKNPRDLDVKIAYDFNGKNSKASVEQYYRIR